MSSLGGGNSERAATKIARFHVFSDTMAMPALMARYVSALGPRRRVWAASGKAAGPRAAVTSANGRISDKFRDGHEGQALAQPSGSSRGSTGKSAAARPSTTRTTSRI